MLIVVGGALCVASAGAATPLVAVGFSTLGTVTAKGFAHSVFEYGVAGLAGQESSYLAYKATGDKNIANIANIVGATVAEKLAGKIHKEKTKKLKNKENNTFKLVCR